MQGPVSCMVWTVIRVLDPLDLQDFVGQVIVKEYYKGRCILGLDTSRN